MRLMFVSHFCTCYSKWVWGRILVFSYHLLPIGKKHVVCSADEWCVREPVHVSDMFKFRYILVWGRGYSVLWCPCVRWYSTIRFLKICFQHHFIWFWTICSQEVLRKVILTQADRTKQWWWRHFVPAQPSTITQHVPDYTRSEPRETAAGLFQISSEVFFLFWVQVCVFSLLSLSLYWNILSPSNFLGLLMDYFLVSICCW